MYPPSGFTRAVRTAANKRYSSALCAFNQIAQSLTFDGRSRKGRIKGSQRVYKCSPPLYGFFMNLLSKFHASRYSIEMSAVGLHIGRARTRAKLAMTTIILTAICLIAALFFILAFIGFSRTDKAGVGRSVLKAKRKSHFAEVQQSDKVVILPVIANSSNAAAARNSRRVQAIDTYSRSERWGKAAQR